MFVLLATCCNNQIICFKELYLRKLCNFLKIFKDFLKYLSFIYEIINVYEFIYIELATCCNYKIKAKHVAKICFEENFKNFYKS